MNMIKSHNNQKVHSQAHGFTLVEMMVVAPMVILIIGVFIGTIVGLTGNVLSSRSSIAVAYRLQDSLNTIKQDVEASSGFLATNNVPITSPQGYNGTDTSFANVSTTQGTALILNVRATTKNPLDPASKVIYAPNQPYACNTPNENKNTPVIVNIVYFVRNNSLWRRVVVPKSTSALFNGMGCDTPIWQQPSCAPGASGDVCATEDQDLVDNLQTNGLSIEYYADPTSTSKNNVADGTGADSIRQTALRTTNTVKVAVTTYTTDAGREKTQTASIYATSPNNNTISQIITTHPTDQLDKTHNSSVSFSAVSSSPNATVQWQQSTDQGSTWANLTVGGTIGVSTVNTSSSTTSTLTITPAPNTMEGYKYRAIFTSGLDIAITNSARLGFSYPYTAFSPLGTNWSNYDNGYNTNGYKKTTSGVVILKGLIKKSVAATAGEVLATLPEGFRPAGNLVFVTGGNSGAARIDVNSNGNVVYVSGSTGAWLSLEGIHFIPNDGRYNNTTVAPGLLNGWTNYGSPFMPATYIVDNIGRVHTQGLVVPGTVTDGTPIFNLPSNLLPYRYMHIADMSAGFSSIGINTTTGVLAKGATTSSYLSTKALFYPTSPSTPATWNAISLQNSWVNYDANTFSPAAYTKGADGIVTVRGLIKSGSTTGDSVIGTLPAGYRPSGRVLATCDTSNSVYCRIDVDTSGNIRFESGNNAWISMDDINFYAD